MARNLLQSFDSIFVEREKRKKGLTHSEGLAFISTILYKNLKYKNKYNL